MGKYKKDRVLATRTNNLAQEGTVQTKEIILLLKEAAEEYFNTCINHNKLAKNRGYIHPQGIRAYGLYRLEPKRGGKFIVFDNSTNELWQEEFDTLTDAINWFPLEVIELIEKSIEMRK